MAVSLLIALISGVLIALPFAGVQSSATIWFGLAPVLWLVVKAPTKKRAALIGAVFSLTWFTIAFSFLWPVAFTGSIFATLYTSAYYVVGLLLVRRIAQDGLVNAVLGTGALWVLIEIVRSIIPVLAFPWMLIGHAWYQHDHLRQGADLLGVYGLSFIIVCINACLAFAVPAFLGEKWHSVPGATVKSAWKICWFFVMVMGGAWCYGELRIMQIAPRLADGDVIAVIQGNVIQKLDRTDEQLQAQVDRHIELHREIVARGKSEGSPPVLVCWAETMVPGIINEDSWGHAFFSQVKESGITTLTGANYREPPLKSGADEEYRDYNAACVYDAQGQETHRYYKRRLVPFGEYIPFADRWHFLRTLRSVTRDQYLPGEKPTPVIQAGTYRIGLNLCVEDVHPDIAREAAAGGADVIINLTNDGWFYQTFGPQAHFMAAMWRSVEVRRPMLRVTNTGRTAAINPLGEATTLVPMETEGTALVRLQRIGPEAKVIKEGDSRTGAESSDQPRIGPVTLYMRLGEVGVAVVFGMLLAACRVFAARDMVKPEIEQS